MHPNQLGKRLGMQLAQTADPAQRNALIDAAVALYPGDPTEMLETAFDLCRFINASSVELFDAAIDIERRLNREAATGKHHGDNENGAAE